MGARQSVHRDRRGRNWTAQPGPVFRPNYPPATGADKNLGLATAVDDEDARKLINEVIKTKINIDVPSQHRFDGPPSIFRVPEHLQQDPLDLQTSPGEVRQNARIYLVDRAYRPSVVPIGPYHRHLSEKGHFATIHTYKWNCVRALLLRHHDQAHANKQLNSCLRWLVSKEVQNSIRQCYSEQIEMEDGELAKLLLADACFIIHLLLDQGPPKDASTVAQGMEMTETSRKMENTNKVNGEMELPRIDRQRGHSKDEVVLNISGKDIQMQRPFVEGLWTWNFVVLDLLKLENQMPFFVIQNIYDMFRTQDDREEVANLAMRLFSFIRPKKHIELEQVSYDRHTKFYHLLHLFYGSLVHQEEFEICTEEQEMAPERIPSASELKRALVSIKLKENASSFLDVTYNKEALDHVIEIPKFQAYAYTESLFRNLIAFEQCCPVIQPEYAYITLFAVLMDCIIDKAKDAGELESEGVLVSRLSSQEDAANLFNRLCKGVHYKIPGSYLQKLFVDVKTDYDSHLRRQLATLTISYCPNKWAVISIAAASLLLLLTIAQTVFTVLSYVQTL